MTRAQAGIAMIFVAAGAMVLELRVMRIEMVVAGGGGTVYRFTRATAWTSMLPAGCAVGATVLLATALRWPARVIALLPAVLAIALVSVTYGLFTDRLIVGTNELDLPGRGFPFREYVVLPYEKIRHVEVIADGQHHAMRISTSDDGVFEIPVGDLAQRAMPRIEAALESHAIKFD
jgi:hypothetical protein